MVEKECNEKKQEEILVEALRLSSGLTIFSFMRMTNNYLRDLKDQLSEKKKECLNYLGLLSEQFSVKN